MITCFAASLIKKVLLILIALYDFAAIIDIFQRNNERSVREILLCCVDTLATVNSPFSQMRTLSENTEWDIWRDYARWRFRVEQAAILRSVNYANFDCREINGRRRRLRSERSARVLSLSFSLILMKGRWERDVLSALGRPCIMHSTCNYCRSILGRFQSRAAASSRPPRKYSRTRSRFIQRLMRF